MLENLINSLDSRGIMAIQVLLGKRCIELLQTKKAITDAQGIHSNEGFLQKKGNVRQGSKDQGSQDLQLKAQE